MPEQRTGLRCRDLQLVADGKVLVEDASFELAPGELVALLGPNGAGKTSLIRGALGLHPHARGESLLGDRAIATHSAMERARLLSYLPQLRPLAWPTPVRDLVALGRFAYGAALGALKGEDLDAVNEAILACDLEHLAHRSAHQLSGGELARVHFARALAAQTPLLIADEPVAALDPYHQLKIMSLIRSYVAAGGGALVVLHDISLAARFADRLIWMKQGRVLATGPPADTLTDARLAEVYEVSAQVDGQRIDILEVL